MEQHSFYLIRYAYTRKGTFRSVSEFENFENARNTMQTEFFNEQSKLDFGDGKNVKHALLEDNSAHIVRNCNNDIFVWEIIEITSIK